MGRNARGRSSGGRSGGGRSSSSHSSGSRELSSRSSESRHSSGGFGDGHSTGGFSGSGRSFYERSEVSENHVSTPKIDVLNVTKSSLRKNHEEKISTPDQDEQQSLKEIPNESTILSDDDISSTSKVIPEPSYERTSSETQVSEVKTVKEKEKDLKEKKSKKAFQQQNSRSISVGILVFILVILIFMVTSGLNASPYPSDKNGLVSTIVRNKLVNNCEQSYGYEDGIGWIEDESEMIKGLESFSDETGVCSYVAFIPYGEELWDIDKLDIQTADQFLNDFYDDRFKDEYHFVFAYFASENDSKDEMNGTFRYFSGIQADRVMDDEALSIFWDYFDIYYYDTSLSAEEMISKIFNDTGRLIMERPKYLAKWIVITLFNRGIIVILILLICEINERKKREKAKQEKAVIYKRAAEQTLEAYGIDTSDLEEKYK